MIDWKIKRPSQQGLFSFLARWPLKNFERRFGFCGETIFLQKTGFPAPLPKKTLNQPILLNFVRFKIGF